jgi:putative sigma-54 modulation protein
MELQIVGTNIELAPTVLRYIERKLGKLNRHLPSIIESKVEISEEKTKSPQQHYLVRVTVTSGVGGATFHGEERGEDLFKAVDKAAAIMTRQLEHHKGKLYKKGRGNSLARGELNVTTKPVKPVRKIVKTKRFAVKPMPIDEAIEQMELLGHNFFLFFDADDEKVKLVYRRNDGNYGLIEPDIG